MPRIQPPSSATSGAPGGGAAVPVVVELSDDFIAHDLATGAGQILAGTFTPTGDTVLMSVEAALSMMGNSRAGLALFVGQPATPGERLYNSGGVPVGDAQIFQVGSVSGESPWGSTTSRTVVVEGLTPGEVATFQVLSFIVGGLEAIPAGDQPNAIAITPDGTRGFVCNGNAGSVTPIILGQPGFSYDQNKNALDEGQSAIAVGSVPIDVAANNSVAVTADLFGSSATIIDVDTLTVLRTAALTGAFPASVALTPNGTHALVADFGGQVHRVLIADATFTTTAVAGGADEMTGIAVSADGASAWVCDRSNGNVYRLNVPAMTTAATIAVGDKPHRVRVSPDGTVWVLCRPDSPAPGRLKSINPATNAVVANYALPYELPNDFAICPVEGQTDTTVRTAWVVHEGGRGVQFYIGGFFAGQAHTIHQDVLPDGGPALGVALNSYGEIWVSQKDHDRVLKYPGGRVHVRPESPTFHGEYLSVGVTDA